MTHAARFVDFVNASPSPFHAVEECARRLSTSGFQRLRETDDWSLKPRGKYFFTRNHSTLFAFVVGGRFTPGNGFHIIGAHTDSPCLKVKPRTNISNGGYVQLGVQLYGGGLWFTWFDRDLSLAGRVILKKPGDQYEHRLVNVGRPVVNIPNLAIHLDRSVNEQFKFNPETHLRPILASAVKVPNAAADADHHPALLDLLAAELHCEPGQISDLELCLYDTQKATIAGLKNEFIMSARIDNLCSTYCGLTALIESADDESLARETNVRVVALFDHEEIGSESQQGAASNMMLQAVSRITKSVPGVTSGGISKSADEVALRKSFLVSADMAHACHPNYMEKHEAQHRPVMHKGPVVKNNANQRYATNAQTAFLIKELARKNSVPVQEFVVRNDSPCGSTIGPILSSRCGMRTVDLGIPQFAMHSIRETCGVDDVDHAVALFRAFYAQFADLDARLSVE